MGIQGRDETNARNERTTAAGTGAGSGGQSEQRGQTGGWGPSSAAGRGAEPPAGWYERGREDLRRRVERFDRNDRWDPNQRDQSGFYRGAEYDTQGREMSGSERAYGYASGYGPHGHPENRSTPSQMYPQRAGWENRNERGLRDAAPRYSHDRDAQAYGDYGHPGTGDRQAYGDMGVGERRSEFIRNLGGTGAATTGGLGERFRRWRKGGQVARDVMTRNPRTARPSDSLQVVAQIMIDEDTGIVPVVEDENRLVGVITDRDIVCRLVARGVDLRAAKAADAMTDDVECVTEQHSLHDVLDLMSDHQVRRVPVVARGDRLVGIISMADLAREADVDEDLQDTFEDISSRRGFWARLR